VKRDGRALAAIGAWLLAMHYVDVHWLIVPALRESFRPHWLDAAAMAAVGGAMLALATALARSASRVPTDDPRLGEALRYRTT